MKNAMDIVPKVLPSDWKRVACLGPDGGVWEQRGGLGVIVSGADYPDGKDWLHLSVSRRERVPSYAELIYVKELFIGKDRKAIMVLPSRAEHVNIHPNVLHLFHCMDEDPLPDFTMGSGSL